MQADQLRSIRVASGLTQLALSQALGVDVRSVRKWEGGERPIPGPVAALMRLLEAKKWKPAVPRRSFQSRDCSTGC